VTGGGLTQGNFQFTSAIFERDTQTFDIGYWKHRRNKKNNTK
jgi:hypothetical protein